MSDFPLGPIRNLLAGSGTTTLEIEGLPGEAPLLSAFGNWRGIAGGVLVLTNLRLVFSPWNVADFISVITWAIPKLGGPDVLGKLVTAAGEAIGGVQIAGSLVSARAGKRAGLFHPPTLIATSDDGSESEFGVLYALSAMNPHPRNTEMRDQFVAKINDTF